MPCDIFPFSHSRAGIHLDRQEQGQIYEQMNLRVAHHRDRPNVDGGNQQVDECSESCIVLVDHSVERLIKKNDAYK